MVKIVKHDTDISTAPIEVYAKALSSEVGSRKRALGSVDQLLQGLSHPVASEVDIKLDLKAISWRDLDKLQQYIASRGVTGIHFIYDLSNSVDGSKTFKMAAIQAVIHENANYNKLVAFLKNPHANFDCVITLAMRQRYDKEHGSLVDKLVSVLTNQQMPPAVTIKFTNRSLQGFAEAKALSQALILSGESTRNSVSIPRFVKDANVRLPRYRGSSLFAPAASRSNHASNQAPSGASRYLRGWFNAGKHALNKLANGGTPEHLHEQKPHPFKR